MHDKKLVVICNLQTVTVTQQPAAICLVPGDMAAVMCQCVILTPSLHINGRIRRDVAPDYSLENMITNDFISYATKWSTEQILQFVVFIRFVSCLKIYN